MHISQVINNHSITVIEKKSITSNNINNSSKYPDSKKVTEAQNIAHYIMDKLHSQEASLPFYLKCAWHIPKGRLDWMIGTSLELGRNPGAYFNALAQKELANKKAG